MSVCLSVRLWTVGKGVEIQVVKFDGFSHLCTYVASW